jgi:anti-anti-sigma factor
MPHPSAYPADVRDELRARGLSCFRIETTDGAARVMLVGGLDFVTSGLARESISRIQDDAPALICDLGDVWFVDISGLRVLLDATADARAAGRRLVITGCPPIIPRMVALLGLDDALEIEPPDRPDAA